MKNLKTNILLKLVKLEDVFEGSIFDHERQLLFFRTRISRNCCFFNDLDTYTSGNYQFMTTSEPKIYQKSEIFSKQIG